MYKVIESFTDLHDADYSYKVGDVFPRKGVDVTEARLKELSGTDNKRGISLIEFAEEEKKPTKKAGAKTSEK